MAKFKTNSRILKKYTAICKNRHSTHVECRLLPRNLFDFYKNTNLLFYDVPRMDLKEAYCLLLDSGQDAVGYTAYTETEKLLVQPLFAKN